MADRDYDYKWSLPSKTLITLESGINVQSGIVVQLGHSGQNNNSTVWNMGTGGIFFWWSYYDMKDL